MALEYESNPNLVGAIKAPLGVLGADKNYRQALYETIAEQVEGLGRRPNANYNVGEVVYPSSNLQYALICTTEGTSDASDLDISANTEGDTITDGTVVWKVVKRNGLGSDVVLPIANGGTGATTASQACANLGIVNLIYPVGSIYMSMSSTNPAKLFGGTWEQIAQGRCLIGAGTGTDSRSESKTFTAGATGGEYNHVLTIKEMPSHGHSASSANTSITGYFGSVVRGDRETAIIASGVFSDAGSIGSKTNGAKQSSETYWRGTKLQATHSHTITVNSSGSSAAHNLQTPYLGCYIWKRTA